MPGTPDQGTVGDQGQAIAPGSVTSLRIGRTGDLIVSELHGKYYETNYNDQQGSSLFWATMSAGVIFPAPAATASNVCTLTNPAGSGKNVILIEFQMVFTIIPGTPLTGLYGLYVNSNPIAAAVTGTANAGYTGSGMIGSGPVPQAKLLTTTTVPAAPTLLIPFAAKITGELAAAAPMLTNPTLRYLFDGTVILTPGTSITPQQTVGDTTNATVLCAFAWEEMPI